jgi:hypothetical protein
MAVTIGELNTEVIAEPGTEVAATGPVSNDRMKDLATIRTELAAIVRQSVRTRAEGFDD